MNLSLFVEIFYRFSEDCEMVRRKKPIIEKYRNYLKNELDWTLIPKLYKGTLVSQIIVLHSLLISKEIPACTSLFQSAQLLIFENFPTCTFIPGI